MTRVVELGFDAAIEAIKNEKTVMFRSGVWNDYKPVPVESAINSIKRSGYGADVSFDHGTATFYVSIPSSGDMW
jgi:hypothetical protein